MINFFDKIRKQLAHDYKSAKYFRYAIGEIVLVDLGILIALSINNWNSNRIDNQSYAIILESLSVDLENDVNELKSLIKVSRNQNKSIVKILYNIEIAKDSMQLIIEELCFLPDPFTPNTSSYDLLENFELFDLLKLKEVSTEVQSLYNSAIKINQESYADRNSLIAQKIRVPKSEISRASKKL